MALPFKLVILGPGCFRFARLYPCFAGPPSAPPQVAPLPAGVPVAAIIVRGLRLASSSNQGVDASPTRTGPDLAISDALARIPPCSSQVPPRQALKRHRQPLLCFL